MRNTEKELHEAMEMLGEELQLQIDLKKKINAILDKCCTWHLRFIYSFLSNLYGE
ncbi:MAG: hypothetical protein IJ295_01050 [Clostridia bacterium]|nr:hypothetical protein [Clostridia bacterium]